MPKHFEKVDKGVPRRRLVVRTVAFRACCVLRNTHTDIMSVPPGFPSLAEELSSAGELPVISLPGLILMKLDAFRPRDREDVRTLMQVHRGRLREVRDHLASHAPDLVHRLAEALSGR